MEANADSAVPAPVEPATQALIDARDAAAAAIGEFETAYGDVLAEWHAKRVAVNTAYRKAESAVEVALGHIAGVCANCGSVAAGENYCPNCGTARPATQVIEPEGLESTVQAGEIGA